MTAAPAPYTHAYYRLLLNTSQRRGFKFSSFPDLTSGSGDQRMFAMRHDCDNDLLAALKMAELETEENVRSTYFLMLRSAMYNLLSPDQLRLARKIASYGHWIGLHFDMNILPDEPAQVIVDQINKERIILSNELGIAIDVVSFHQPCQRVINNEIALSCINTYDSKALRGVFYASDSNMRFRYGDMLDWINKTAELKVQFLIHPEWWTAKKMAIGDKWKLMLEHQRALAVDNLHKRESAFTLS